MCSVKPTLYPWLVHLLHFSVETLQLPLCCNLQQSVVVSSGDHLDLYSSQNEGVPSPVSAIIDENLWFFSKHKKL